MQRRTLKQLSLSIALLLLATGTFAQLRLPAGYFYKQLPNGLKVVVIENKKVPLATIEIAVKNGSFTEDSVYNGLSHMFEHMFFKANRDYPTQAQFLKRTQELGAIWNGTTGEERVNYFFTFDTDSLAAGLKFLDAAIRFPVYRIEDMQKERKVVDGEFQRAESDPGFQLDFQLEQILWGDKFTRKNPIGIHDIINTATPEKMMVIKNKYYFPNNSLLTICGDVNHDDAFAKAEAIFGDWVSSGSDPILKYPIPPFKPLAKSQVFVHESTIARTPLMQFDWQGPAFSTDSVAVVAAEVFSTITGMNSSKLQQALVDKGLATSVAVSHDVTRYIGAVEIDVTPNPNKLKECYDELMHQVAMWDRADYFTDEQLKDAKAIMLRRDQYSKEKPSRLPGQLSNAWASTSFNFYTDKIDDYQKVTRDDIKKYLDTYVVGKPMVGGLILSPDLNKTANAASFFVVKN
jgi:zinc protease